MVTVEINVTKKDIGQGVCKDAGNCPIALAAIRAGFKEVSVDGCLGFGVGKSVDGIFDDYVGLNLPKRAKDFIDNFDEKQPVKPFKFRIKLKNSVAKQLKLRKSAIVAA